MEEELIYYLEILGQLNKDEKDKKILDYYRWRVHVIKKDSYMCQVCGIHCEILRCGILRAHYLNLYTKDTDLRDEVNNSVCLCERCYNDFHHQYGYNNTKEQFLKFKEIANYCISL